MPFPPRKPIRRITRVDSSIFASILRARRPLPVKQIAQRIGKTWPTTNTHIQKLQKLNVLRIDKTIRKNRVNIDPRFLSKIRKSNLFDGDFINS